MLAADVQEGAVVIADPDPPASLLACARGAGAAPIVCLGRDFRVEQLSEQWQGVLVNRDGRSRTLPVQPAGSLLPANVCAALQAAELLGCEFSDEQLGEALSRARPRGRCERQQWAGREYVLDVAHNPAAVNNLVEILNVSHCKGKTIALFSVMNDKDIPAMIRAAAGCFSAWFVADQANNPRAARGGDVAALLRAEGAEIVEEAFMRFFAVRIAVRERKKRFLRRFTVAGGDHAQEIFSFLRAPLMLKEFGGDILHVFRSVLRTLFRDPVELAHVIPGTGVDEFH